MGSGYRESNVAAVGRQISAGCGHACLQETTYYIEGANNDQVVIHGHQTVLGRCWSDLLEQTIKEATEEKKQER